MKASDKFKEDLEAAVKDRKLFHRMQSTGGSYTDAVCYFQEAPVCCCPEGYVFKEDKMLDGFTGAGWYFWDETWTHITGPYPSHQECRKACEDYARNL